MYYCRSCKHRSDAMLAQCPECRKYNTFQEGVGSHDRRMGYIEPCKIRDLDFEQFVYQPTNTRELDRVIGGGTVAGGLYALCGGPGAGKSTLALQVANDLSITEPGDAERQPVLYISAEEVPENVGKRAVRLSPETESFIWRERDILKCADWVYKHKPFFVVWDSIQKFTHPEEESRVGSISQVLRCAEIIEAVTQDLGCTSIIICHVVKDGSMAGPKTFEHMVDTVLYFEREGAYRMLRASKNRFGSAEEVGIFQMSEEGLLSIENPIALLDDQHWSSGNVRCLAVTGARPILGEVQALWTAPRLERGRRVVNGLDRSRAEVVLAVLERRCGLPVDGDVWLNSPSIAITDPGADLAMALAILSSNTDEIIEPDIAAFGEIGLSGELRMPEREELRFNQAKALGIKEDNIISPDKFSSIDEVCDYLGLSIETKKAKKRKKK